MVNEFPGPRRCSSCRYFHRDRCRRHPPQVVVEPAWVGGEAHSSGTVGAWPEVGPGDWCGDYRQAAVPGRKPGRPPLATLTREQRVAAVTSAIMETLEQVGAVGITKAAGINRLKDAASERCGKTVVSALAVPVLKDLLAMGKVLGGWPGDHPGIPHVDASGNGGAMFWLPEKKSTAAPSAGVPEVTVE